MDQPYQDLLTAIEKKTDLGSDKTLSFIVNPPPLDIKFSAHDAFLE
jgi:hypothetical protein